MTFRKSAVLIVFACLILAVPARADVVTDWNATAAQIAIPARPGPSSILDLAMVHAAMHDAIQAYDGRFEPYAVTIPNATGSPVAAAASAAHAVLVARFPAQAGSLNTLLNTYLSNLGLLGNPGVGVGQVAAAGILNLRVGDGSFPASFPAFNGVRNRANGVRRSRPSRRWRYRGWVRSAPSLCENPHSCGPRRLHRA